MNPSEPALMKWAAIESACSLTPIDIDYVLIGSGLRGYSPVKTATFVGIDVDRKFLYSFTYEKDGKTLSESVLITMREQPISHLPSYVGILF